MSGDGGRRAHGRLRHGPRGRRLLSLLFVVHWGAVAVLLLPLGTDSLGRMPRLLRVPLEVAAAPLARAAWPAVRLWFDATSTRQHWMLFAPDPADWSASVEATAWYAVGRAGERPRWQADTLAVPGPGEDPFPHWTRPRPYDLFFNLVYEGLADFYRRVLARRLCRELGQEGRRPVGISLAASWRPLDPPWMEVPRAPLRQSLGGFSCAELLVAPRPPKLDQ